MRGGVTAAVTLAFLLVTVPPAGAGSSRPSGFASSMTVTASPRAAKAHAVRLRLTLRYQMQCGYAGAGPLVVTFPRRLKLPQQLAAGAVLLGGKAVAATVEGRQVIVRVAPNKGKLCDLMGIGSLRLVFTPLAKLSNPARAGSYRFQASHAKRTFEASLTIEPAA